MDGLITDGTMTMELGQENAQQKRLERKERRHENRRKTILDAARAILARQGIQNFSVNAVAAAADVSKPAVYYYFESKEELIYELALDAEVEESRALERALDADRGGVEALADLIKGYVEHYLRDIDQYRIRYVWPQVLGISWRLAEARGRRETRAVESIVSARLGRDQSEGRVASNIDAQQLTPLARVIAHGIVAQMSSATSDSGEYSIDAHEICESACAQFRSWVAA
jgi:AcrR family transcriptional regulator